MMGLRRLLSRHRGEAIAVTVGVPHAIPLKANHTTPYRWQAVLPRHVSLAGAPAYVSDPAPPLMCGVGGMETFTVVCARRGRYRLRFEHRHIDGTPGEVVHRLLVAR